MKNMKHILNEGFDRLLVTEEKLVEYRELTGVQKDVETALTKAVEDAKRQIGYQYNGKTIVSSWKLKPIFIDVIEKYFPNNDYWEVLDTDLWNLIGAKEDIINDLPRIVALSIKPEFLGEEKECGFEDCDDEECNESNNKELSDSERKSFISKLTAELQKEPYGYSAEEANDIAIKRADDLDPSWRVRWGNDIDKQVRQELRNSVTKKEFGEGKCNESIGDRVAEYQKWVDYDMKKYGKISGKTMGILKREGFTVVKDEYGDLEVIPEEKDHSSIKESKESDVKGWWDEVEKWNAENGNKYTIDNEDADVEDMRVAMWDMLMELKGVAPELYKKGKKIYNKYRGLTKITEGKRSNKRTFRYDVGDNEYSFYCETEDTRYGFRHLCSMFLRGVEVGDSVKKYYNRTWEMFDYQSAMLSAVENSSVSEEDKKSLKAQINEGEGLRESKKCNEAFYNTTRVLEIVSPRTKARLKRVIDTQKKYGNDMEISVIIDSPYKAHLTYGEGGANYYKDEDGKWKHDIGYIKIDSSLANSIISDVCRAAGMCDESKKCEDFDDDISDDEYYAELEAHIKRIPSYDDEKLKAEYEEFKDSTHEDDIRVEIALKDEMVKRGFIRMFESAKESVDESKQLNEGTSNFWSMNELPLLIFDDDEAMYDKLWDAARLELGTDASDEEVSDKVEELYDDIDYCTLVDEEIEGLKQDVEDFNRENSDTEIKVEIKPGYYEAYQLYCNDKELSDEEVEKVSKFFDDMKKKYYLTTLAVAYRASNGETGYSIVEEKESDYGIFKSRREADAARKNDPYHNSSERIVKVDGGYRLMSERDYQIWKGQK